MFVTLNLSQESVLPSGDIIHTLDIDSEDWEQAPMSDSARSADPEDDRAHLQEEEEDGDDDCALAVDPAAVRWRRATRALRMQQMRARRAEAALPFPERPALLRDAADMGSYARLRAALAPATHPRCYRSAYDRAPRLAPRDRPCLLPPGAGCAFCPELAGLMAVVPDIPRPAVHAPAPAPAPAPHVRPGSDVRCAAMLRQGVARVLARAGGFAAASTQAMDVLCDVTGALLARVCRAMRVRLDNMEQPALPACALVTAPEHRTPVLTCGSPYMVLNRALLDVGLQGFFTVMKHLAADPACVVDASSAAAAHPPEGTSSEEAPDAPETSDAVPSEVVVKTEKEEDASDGPKTSEAPGTTEADSGAMVDDNKESVKASCGETGSAPEPEDKHDSNAETKPDVEEQKAAADEEHPGDDAMKDDNEAKPDCNNLEGPTSDQQESSGAQEAEPNPTEAEKEPLSEAKEAEEVTEARQDEPTEQQQQQEEAKNPEQKSVEEPIDEIEEVESPAEKDVEPSRQTGPATRRRTRGLAKKQEPAPAPEEEAPGAEEESHGRSTRRRNARPAVKRQASQSTMALRKNSPTRKRR